MKRSIGIDINRNKISIVQLCCSGGKYSLERASVREIPEGGSAEENSRADIKTLINSVITEGDFDASAKITVSAPAEKVFFQNFRTELLVNGDIQRLIKFELEDDFPIPFDAVIAGICGGRELKGDKREYLIGAINYLELQKHVQIIKEAHLKCSKVTADVCALNAAAFVSDKVIEDTASIIIHADNLGVILAISKKGRLVCVRHFNCQDLTNAESSLTSVQVLTREIEMTLRAIFGAHIDTKLSIMISSNNELFDDLSSRLSETIHCEITVLDPFMKIHCSEQYEPNADIVIATGLALIGTDETPDALNFLTVDEFNSNRAAETKRGLFITCALLFVIGAVLFIRLFYELHNLENQHELIKKQIREVFVKTLPEEKKIVNEPAQMNEKLEALKTEYSILAAGLSERVLPLRILQIISEKVTPDQNVRINDISMSPESVRLAGVAPSFASVDNLMSSLRQVSEFNNIEVLSTDVDLQSSGVRFTLSIKTQ